MTQAQSRQSSNRTIPFQIRQGLILLSLSYFCVIVLSFFVFSRDTRSRHTELAETEARSIFETIMALRAWNAGLGGVYVPVTERIQPNPYLENPGRDLVTDSGWRLTKINPAYMTRLLSETIADRSGLLIHITSLNPIRPANAPDPWEEEALRRYAATGLDSRTLTTIDGKSYFRYLQGMRVEETCLPCHAKQGYKLGDVRGGISVTIPYDQYEAAARSEQRGLLLLHSLFFVLGLGMIWAIGWRLLSKARALDSSASRIRTLEKLLPICSYCKKIRLAGTDPSDMQNWEPFENYISSRAETSFSHSICPECLRRNYPEE